CDMVFLDQNTVMQTHALIFSAADCDCIFLCQAQPWQGFPGVVNLRARALDGIDIMACRGGGSRERLQKIQGAALGGKQGACIPGDLAKYLAGLTLLTFGYFPLNPDGR